MLTADNYKTGFLMDEELLAGISEDSEHPGTFTAFVVRHSTGETLGVQKFNDVFEAIRTLNQIPRSWAFEKVSKCGSGNCGKEGGCGGGSCGRSKTTSESSCSTGACPIES